MKTVKTCLQVSRQIAIKKLKLKKLKFKRKQQVGLHLLGEILIFDKQDQHEAVLAFHESEKKRLKKVADVPDAATNFVVENNKKKEESLAVQLEMFSFGVQRDNILEKSELLKSELRNIAEDMLSQSNSGEVIKHKIQVKNTRSRTFSRKTGTQSISAKSNKLKTWLKKHIIKKKK